MAVRINTAAMTNEELVGLIQSGVETECAYQQLFINLKPIILGEAQMYRSQMIDLTQMTFCRKGISSFGRRFPMAVSKAANSPITTFRRFDADTLAFTAVTH